MTFYEAQSNFSNFAISFSKAPQYDFSIFARGYAQAANQLSELLLARDKFADYEAYPVVFLYRHALELHLKHVIYKSALLSAYQELQNVDGHLQGHHNLVDLSEKAGAILIKLFNDEQIKNVANQIQAIAFDIDKVDHGSYAFRYPIDKKGNPSVPQKPTINLQMFHQVMKGILNELDIIAFGLDVETNKAHPDIHQILDEINTPN